MTVLGIE